MSAPRRTTTWMSGLVLPCLLLAGCGGADDADEPPSSYLVTDLDGQTAAPDGVVIEDSTPSSSPTSTPAPTASPTRKPTPTPTKTPAEQPSTPSRPGITGNDLVEVIAGAAGKVETVRITIGDEGSTPDISAGVVYGETDAFDATVTAGAGQRDAVFRRIDGTLYAGTSAGLEPVDPADPRLSGSAGALVPAFLAWDPLLDLRSALQDVADVPPGAVGEEGGVPITTFTFDVEVASLPTPSLVVPAGTTSGTATATLVITDDALPVRIELALDGGPTVVVGYSAWGGRVQILAPQPPPGG